MGQRFQGPRGCGEKTTWDWTRAWALEPDVASSEPGFEAWFPFCPALNLGQVT